MAETNKIKFGIFPKMLIAMALIAVVPLAITWYINLQSTTNRIHEHVNQQLDRVADGLVSYVDTWVEMNVRMLQQNAALPQILSMNPSQQNVLLKKITDVYDWNYLAFTVDKEGQNIGRSDGKKTKYYGDRHYVQTVLRGAPRGQQVLIGKTSGKPAFVLSVPIQQPNKPLQGVLAIAMGIVEISERVTQVRMGKTGYAFLVDENGRVIAHQSPEFTKTRKDMSDHPAAVAISKGLEDIIYTDENGIQMVATARKTHYGWYLVAEQTYDDAFAEIDAANRKALILLGATLAVVVLVALLLSRGFSIPIQRLTTISEEISRGKISSQISYTNRKDEIGALARAIDRLSTSIRLAMKRLRQGMKKPATAA